TEVFDQVFSYIINQRNSANTYEVLWNAKTEQFDIGGDKSHHNFGRFVDGTGTTQNDISALMRPNDPGYTAASAKVATLVAKWRADGSEPRENAFVMGVYDFS